MAPSPSPALLPTTHCGELEAGFLEPRRVFSKTTPSCGEKLLRAVEFFFLPAPCRAALRCSALLCHARPPFVFIAGTFAANEGGWGGGGRRSGLRCDHRGCCRVEMPSVKHRSCICRRQKDARDFLEFSRVFSKQQTLV